MINAPFRRWSQRNVVALGAVAIWLLVSQTAETIASEPKRRPNVVLIMTDDQGYGDLGCHGNKIIRTPNLDQLHKQSVRLTNFHVDPTCSPTRSALMTGRYSTRTGVWHTIMGRSILRHGETTIANLFAANGYRTGIFGKWHLGDNYPFRPQHRGFHEVVVHGGGGVGQTPDYWGNDYFDDTYFHNGKPTKHKGYCTDVFFGEALRFIKENKDRPFFCYLPTNAAHSPYFVAEKYSKPYRDKGVPETRAKFWGMVTNIDDNVGVLLEKLRAWKLEKDTILIFMTDNGTSAGSGRGGFNAGMRGAKGSEHDGGHRVPFFIRWPGKLKGGRDVAKLTAHIDVLPTLGDLCRLTLPARLALDGRSLVPLLEGASEWKDRTLFVHSQRIENPMKYRKCAVMTERHRLVNGKELYDVVADPGQKKDLAEQHPKLVAELRRKYEAWYQSLSTEFDKYARIVIGANEENPTTLTCHDWHGENVPWHQNRVRQDPYANGFWTIAVAKDGKYRFTLRQRPAQVKHELKATSAKVSVGKTSGGAKVAPKATSVSIELQLKAGKSRLQTWLNEGDKSRGAFFVEVRRLE